MAYTCLIVLDPEIPFTLPEMKGNSGTDGANYKIIKLSTPPVLPWSLCKFWYGYLVIIIDISIKKNQKVQVGKDQERRNQRKIPTPKTEVGKNQRNNQVLIP